MRLDDVDLLDLDRFVAQEHYDMFALLRREAPIHWHEEPDGPGFWNVVRYDDLVEVNRQAEMFSSEVGGISIAEPTVVDELAGGFDLRGVLMLTTDPPKHTRYRKLVNRGFTPRMIGLLEEYLRHRTTLIIDEVIEDGECDFVTEVAAELALQAIAEIMGVPQEDRQKFSEWSNKMLAGRLIAGRREQQCEDGELARIEAAAAIAELYSYANSLAAQRREDPRDDIITRLINAEVIDDDGQPTTLNEVEIDAFMLLLSAAGNETTRNATSHGLWQLMTNPDQFERLKADRDGLMDTAVDEIVRYASPVLHFRRTVTADTEIGGRPVTAGDKVVMWHVSANRDEDQFENPDRFDVSRSPNNHVGFGGGGPHFCLGANLARMELRLVFDEVCRRLPDVTPTGEPERLRSNFINGIKHLPVRFTPGDRVDLGPLPD